MTFRTDIDLTDDVGGRIDGRGDVASDEERRNMLEQRAVLRTLNVTFDERGETITPEAVENLRDLVETELEDDPVIDVPVTAYVNGVSDNSVRLLVELGDLGRISLNVP